MVKTAIFHNLNNDDLFAIILDSELCYMAYSLVGQHSNVSLSYIKESYNATINEESIKLFNEVKRIYKKCKIINQYEMRNLLNID